MDEDKRQYRASIVLMFDYSDQSIEHARSFGKSILASVEEAMPTGLDGIYVKGIANVVRVEKKNPLVPRPKRIIEVGRMSAADLFEIMNKNQPPPTVEFEGVKYKGRLRGHRLRLFKKNPTCVVCGVTGTEFRLERNWTHEPGKAHWNLYGHNGNGHWVMMTVDHRIPLSKGGADHPDNFQTMCSRCNAVKKDDKLTVEQVREKLKLPSTVFQISQPPGVPGHDDDRPVLNGMDVAASGGSPEKH